MLRLKHKDTRLWHDSMDLVEEVYRLTSSYPVEERYGFVSQMRKAGVSVSSNYAEGSARRTEAERTRFYEIARSSVVEIDTQAEASLRLGYIKREGSFELSRLLNTCFAQLSGLMNAIATTR